jgi:CDGSH-type Zn-finger protein/uncharacterized Fe-S cluster protein YjdI
MVKTLKAEVERLLPSFLYAVVRSGQAGRNCIQDFAVLQMDGRRYPSSGGVAHMADKIHKYEADKITVTYDRKRCIHAAECVRGLPEVFNTAERPWVKPDESSADKIAEVVLRCPTGALHFERKDGGPAEVAPDLNIAVVQANGPLYMFGEVEIVNDQGETVLRDTRIALCRCGASQNKPFCDNSHRASNFTDPGDLGTTGKIISGNQPQSGKLTILPKLNGSLKCEGAVRVFDATGTSFLNVFDVSLCRCGHSHNKPFCDGTHKETGFRTG